VAEKGRGGRKHRGGSGRAIEKWGGGGTECGGGVLMAGGAEAKRRGGTRGGVHWVARRKEKGAIGAPAANQKKTGARGDNQRLGDQVGIPGGMGGAKGGGEGGGAVWSCGNPAPTPTNNCYWWGGDGWGERGGDRLERGEGGVPTGQGGETGGDGSQGGGGESGADKKKMFFAKAGRDWSTNKVGGGPNRGKMLKGD